MKFKYPFRCGNSQLAMFEDTSSGNFGSVQLQPPTWADARSGCGIATIIVAPVMKTGLWHSPIFRTVRSFCGRSWVHGFRFSTSPVDTCEIWFPAAFFVPPRSGSCFISFLAVGGQVDWRTNWIVFFSFQKWGRYLLCLSIVWVTI